MTCVKYCPHTLTLHGRQHSTKYTKRGIKVLNGISVSDGKVIGKISEKKIQQKRKVAKKNEESECKKSLKIPRKSSFLKWFKTHTTKNNKARSRKKVKRRGRKIRVTDFCCVFKRQSENFWSICVQCLFKVWKRRLYCLKVSKFLSFCCHTRLECTNFAAFAR